MALVTDEVADDPVQRQRWIVRRLPQIQAALEEQGHRVSPETIRRVRPKHRLSPKAHVKQLVPPLPPDRDAPFEYMQMQRAAFAAADGPIIRVDTRKKKLITCLAQPGQSWQAPALAVYRDGTAQRIAGPRCPLWHLRLAPA
ncbi:MAG: hypothetical protein M5U01_14570 [Ardenticatenaceae bacterium]|nr:hypothetical protein [Ardenticatenaceae bacterium]